MIVGGAVEEISLEKLMEDVKLEVEEQRSKGITDEKVLAEAVEQRLKSKGKILQKLGLFDFKIYQFF